MRAAFKDTFDFLDKPVIRTEQDMLAWLEPCYKLADAERRKFEPDVFTNISFLAGNQWASFRSDVQRFRRTTFKAPEAQAQVTVNKTLPLVRSAISSLTQNMPKQDAIASTNDPEDIGAAALGTKLLDWKWFQDDEQTILRHDTLWAICCGENLRMNYWDPTAGREGLRGPDGEGDSVTKRINFFRYLKNPWDDSTVWPPKWIIESDVRDIGWVKDTFGKEVQPEEVSDARRCLDQLLLNVVESTSPQTPEDRKNAVILKRMYHRPTLKYPRGRVFIWVTGTFLAEHDLPDGRMPFSRLGWFSVPGRLYDLPMITNLRPLQKEANITLSQIIEQKNRQLRLDIIYEGGVPPKETRDALTGRKMIRTARGSKWELARYDDRTRDAKELELFLDQEMKDIAGVHEPTSGEHTQSVRTLGELQLLRESDLAGLELFFAGLRVYNCKIGEAKLRLYHDHAKNLRVVNILGRNTVRETSYFYGADLRDTRDVRSRTLPPLTPSMRVRLQVDAQEAGLFPPYETIEEEWAKRLVLRAMIPDIEEEMQDWTPLEQLGKMVGALRQQKAKLEMLMMAAQKEAILHPPPTPEEMNPPEKPTAASK